MNQDVKHCDRCGQFCVAPCNAATDTPRADKYEKLGLTIDRLDNLAHALQLQLPASMHLEQLRNSLPDVVAELKKAFVELANENPWA
jgi:hypothetical protein